MTMVTLGGKAYELKPIPLRPARKLRQKIEDKLGGFTGILNGVGNLEINKIEDVLPLVDNLKGLLWGSINAMEDWVFEYSQELRSDRERIEETATDEEMLKAFWEVVKMLYPFGGMMGKLSGLAAQATSMSSRSANGESGQTSSTEQP